ncbi:hypothetical protein NDU88_004613 [Pleurodeles waltl]|uniref:Uncharacterized protein n=1 Tax=Pleurodeles waltl TaxID=8319 RepID=A0AAV7QCJ1_PLEWA|nr:hypothetical protein NDU88_004613 [Pleurodeles waltl]
MPGWGRRRVMPLTPQQVCFWLVDAQSQYQKHFQCIWVVQRKFAPGPKRSRTNALLETLRLRKDAMDQAIALLKAQLPGLPGEKAESPRGVGVPPREAFHSVPKRAYGLGKRMKELQG